MMKKQAGFTLIELIMVIVILGILAAVALPRFVNLQVDARIAKAQGLFGSVRAASALTHAVSLARNNPATITMEGVAITMVNGYPDSGNGAIFGIADAANISAANDGVTITEGATVTTIDMNGATALANCRISYTEAIAPASPVITVNVTNC